MEQTSKLLYQAKHRLFGDQEFFTDYELLVDTAIDIASEEAQMRLSNALKTLVIEISNEMIDSVREIKIT